VSSTNVHTLTLKYYFFFCAGSISSRNHNSSSSSSSHSNNNSHRHCHRRGARSLYHRHRRRSRGGRGALFFYFLLFNYYVCQLRFIDASILTALEIFFLNNQRRCPRRTRRAAFGIARGCRVPRARGWRQVCGNLYIGRLSFFFFFFHVEHSPISPITAQVQGRSVFRRDAARCARFCRADDARAVADASRWAAGARPAVSRAASVEPGLFF
jgi:hypothetical protein